MEIEHKTQQVSNYAIKFVNKTPPSYTTTIQNNELKISL